MRALLGSALAMVLVLAAWVVPGWSQEVLSNQSVVNMVRAGLPESVIIAKIRTSANKFDLSSSSLIALKHDGVPDRVLDAMMGVASGGVSSAPVAGPRPTRMRPVPPAAFIAGTRVVRPGVFQVVGDQYVPLPATQGDIEDTDAFFTSKRELVLPGRRSQFRITDRQPTFASSRGKMILVRLKLGGSHDDRNLKYMNGYFFGSKIGFSSDDVIRVTSEKNSSGLLVIRPEQPLEPGEYAFTWGVMANEVYDFGIE
jgi:hypothetical protein